MKKDMVEWFGYSLGGYGYDLQTSSMDCHLFPPKFKHLGRKGKTSMDEDIKLISTKGLAELITRF